MALCVSFWLWERIQIARRGPDNVTVYWICFIERRRERERDAGREGETQGERQRGREREEKEEEKYGDEGIRHAVDLWKDRFV